MKEGISRRVKKIIEKLHYQIVKSKIKMLLSCDFCLLSFNLSYIAYRI